MIQKSQLNQSALAALGPAEEVASQAAAPTGGLDILLAHSCSVPAHGTRLHREGLQRGWEGCRTGKRGALYAPHPFP